MSPGQPPDPSPAVELRELRFAWPGRPTLLDIGRFALARGERVFLRGASGSGKSTMLGLIGGVLTPTSGDVMLLGRSLTTLRSAERDRLRGEQIGFIFQLFNLIPYLSVLDNVVLPLQFSPARAARLGGREPAAEAQRLLTALGLESGELWARSISQLSIGQQQRVAAARALIGNPPLIVADEPTSSLDHDAREQFLELLQRECRAQGASLLFVSHDTSLGHLFDRVVALESINRASGAAAGLAA